jgi:hypothetical protein
VVVGTRDAVTRDRYLHDREVPQVHVKEGLDVCGKGNLKSPVWDVHVRAQDTS